MFHGVPVTVLVVGAMLLVSGKPVAHGVKVAAAKAKHAAVHVVTLGRK